ncbi:MAG TPA: LacI family DNA-binding transcriptional regulator [Pseudolysinimonas sp.]|nr:LacI family DNA-binding transcriptional regulator [Pseudolysinimonas sp.]
MKSVSVTDVAVRAGVSVGTVSNVLNRPDKVSARRLELVNQAIAELGFVRNDAARQLRAGSSRAIGLVILDVRNPFFTELLRGAEAAADEHGSAILLGNSDQDPGRESFYLDLFEEQRVRGVLLSPIGDVRDRMTRLRARGIPAVLVDRRVDDAGASSVSVDDVAGGRMAVEHLLEQGRRRIAFVGGPLSLQQVADRLEGARQAIQTTTDAMLEVIECPQLTILDGRAVGNAIVARRARDMPDAVFAANDLVALGLVQSFVMTRGLAVPDDVAVIGYDDIDFASSAVVPISSVRQPTELIGRTAVEMIIEQIDDETAVVRDVVYQPELVVRQSTIG